jgi:hypothetical protein
MCSSNGNFIGRWFQAKHLSVKEQGLWLLALGVFATQGFGQSISKIEPAAIQVNQPMTITLETTVAPSSVSVTIGSIPAILLTTGSNPVGQLAVRPGKDTPTGEQTLAIQSDGKQFTHLVTILPTFISITASPTATRGVIAGESVAIEMNGPLPTGIEARELKPKLLTFAGSEVASLDVEAAQDKKLMIKVPQSVGRGQYVLQISVADAKGVQQLLGNQFVIRVEKWGVILGCAIAPCAIVTLVIIVLCMRTSKQPLRLKRYNWLQLLFMEEETKTYSLSRAQFICWLAAIVIGYVFIFFARGLVEAVWAFPPLSGFAYTFLISLGTLVAAQATSAAKGAKGAGPEEPQISDLVVHGGVLALERVQQVLWTAIAIFMFLWITFKTYETTTALPTVPNEMLALMGISSAGYIGGKMARKAGPIIKQILASPGSVIIKIFGESLSKDAFVWVDGVQQPKDAVSVLEVDKDTPDEFATALKVNVSTPGSEGLSPIASDWLTKEHTIIVVNADGQRAERTIPVPKINSVEPTDADGKTTLNITGEGILPGAAVLVFNSKGTAITVASAKQDPSDPNKLTVTLEGVLPPKTIVTVKVTNPDKQTAVWDSKVLG